MSEVAISNNGQALAVEHISNTNVHLSSDERALLSSGSLARLDDSGALVTASGEAVPVVPDSRTINKKPLTSNIVLSPDDVGAASKSKIVTSTISTTWTGDTAPYTQSISLADVKDNSIVEISLPSTATIEEVKAYQALNLQDGGQAAGSITLRAFGTKNTSNITVTIIIRGDI